MTVDGGGLSVVRLVPVVALPPPCAAGTCKIPSCKDAKPTVLAFALKSTYRWWNHGYPNDQYVSLPAFLPSIPILHFEESFAYVP